MNQSHFRMESCLGNSAIAVESDAASGDHQDGKSLIQRMLGSQNKIESNSPRDQRPPEFNSPRPDLFQDHEGREIRNRVAIDQQSECAVTIDSPLMSPVGANVKDTMVTPDEKEVHTKSHSFKKKTATEESKSPTHNIQCISQLINGVKCITFTTPDDTGRKRTADRDDGVVKKAKRRLVFPDACYKETYGDVKGQGDGTNGYSYQGIEQASTRADRIVTSLQWNVVKVLREATMIKGKDIVLVKPRGLSWAPSLSALRDKDGTLTVLSDSNMAALFQIEDQLNIDLSPRDVSVLSVANRHRGAKNTPTGNVDQKELGLNTEVQETNLTDWKQRQRDTLTQENSSIPVKAFTDETGTGNEIKKGDEHLSLKAKYVVENCNQKTDFPTDKVFPELPTPTKGSVIDDEGRVMKAAIQLLSEIDISSDQCIDLKAIDHVFEEVDKNLQFIDESKLNCNSYEIDQAVSGLHTDWDQISEKLLRDLESIERRLSLAVTEEQHPQDCEKTADVIDWREGQSSINMEIFGELNFEDDETYSSLSPGQQQKYLDMLMKEASTITPYDELIFNLIGNDL